MATTTAGDILQLAKSVGIHWAQVNSALGRNPLTLRGGYDKSRFDADVTDLENQLARMPDVENGAGIAQDERDRARPALKVRLKQFRAAVENKLGDTPFFTELPLQPPARTTEATFLKAFDDMQSLWTRINAATIPGFLGPLMLAGRYTLAQFTADLAALRTIYDRTRQTLDTADLARGKRDRGTRALWERVKQYRKGCTADLDPGSDLLKTVP